MSDMYTDAGERAFEALGEIACVFLEPLMPRYRVRIASDGGASRHGANPNGL